MPRRAGGRSGRDPRKKSVVDAFALGYDGAQEGAWSGVLAQRAIARSRQLDELAGGNSTLKRAVEALRAGTSADERAKALGIIKSDIRTGDLRCEAPGCACAGGEGDAAAVCEAALRAGKIALVVMAAPTSKKIRRLASSIVLALAEALPATAGGEALLSAAEGTVLDLLRDLDRGGNLEGCSAGEFDLVLANAGASLRFFFACKALEAPLLDRVPRLALLEGLSRILQHLCARALRSVQGQKSATDQYESVEHLEDSMMFLLSVLDGLTKENAHGAVPEPVLAALERLRDEVLLPLLAEADVGTTFAFKPVRTHAGVALIRMNNVACLASEASMAEALHDSILHLAQPEREPQGFLAPFCVASVCPEVCAILLHQAVGAFPADALFIRSDGAESGAFLADLVMTRLKTISEEYVFDKTVQTACLKGMDEWCKVVLAGLRSPELLPLLWPFWRACARATCLERMDFVLENWSHGARKARYHLEPLMQSALTVLDYVRLELAKEHSELEGAADEAAALNTAHAHLVARLVHEVVHSDTNGMHSNLKAALPLLVGIIERDGVALMLECDPGFISGVLRCFTDGAHVGRIAATAFLAIVKDLERTHVPRSVWLVPLAAALTGEDESVAEAISTKGFLPRLIKLAPGFDAHTLLEAFGKDVSVRERVMVWGTFRDAGVRLVFHEDEGEDAKEITTAASDKDKILAVRCSHVRAALVHTDAAVCIKALNLISSPGGSRLGFPSEELFSLLRYFYARLGKWPHATMRHRVVQASTLLFEWLQVALANGKVVSEDRAGAERALDFAHWLVRLFVAACYPLVPLDRAELGLELLGNMLALLRDRAVATNLVKHGLPSAMAPLTSAGALPHWRPEEAVLALINMLMNAYDRVHGQAFDVLISLPAPLVGLDDDASLQRWLRWMLVLLSGSRVRDTDAGAAMVRLLYAKYVRELGWALDLPFRGGTPWREASSLPAWQAPERASANDRASWKCAASVAVAVRELVDESSMRIACAESEQCERAERAYCVGAVLVDREGHRLAQGFSRELPGNTHAEETALIKVGGGEQSAANAEDDAALGRAAGGTMFTTMEPCSKRLSGNRPCTDRCIAAGVARVVVGVREPSKFVVCEGTQQLRDAGIQVDYVRSTEVQQRCMLPNLFLFPDTQVPALESPSADAMARFALQSEGKDMPRELASLHFMWQLVGALKARVRSLQEANGESGAGSTGLPDGHGLTALADPNSCVFGTLRAIRYCWQDTPKLSAAWRPIVTELLETVFTALNLAKTVVSGMTGSAGGDPGLDAAPPEAEAEAEAGADPLLKVGGAVQGLEGDTSDRKAVEGQRRVVMSSWLLIRDGSEMLQALVERSPLQVREGEDAASAASEEDWVVSFADVKRIGDWLLDALGVLKHVGAVGYSVNALQAVCARLLSLRKDKDAPALAAERSMHLLSLPRHWLEQLLARLVRGTQGFVLRKSAGFAGSFLALARSEPRSCKAALLQEMTQRLLALATDMSVALGTRVHSMNILKAITEDGSLRSDLSGDLLSEVMLLAIRGFRSQHWQVRNSAMMIFAKVVKRTLGDNHQGDESSVGNRVAASFFFSRYESVRQQLLADLERIAGHAATTRRDPCLFPWLLLLSRLEPQYLLGSARAFARQGLGDEERAAWDAANDDVLAFVPPLIKCAELPEGMARMMAARALGSIVPNTYILPTLEQLCDQLGGEARLSHNHSHGVLLHLKMLLEAIGNRKIFPHLFRELELAEEAAGPVVEPLVARLEQQLAAALRSALDRTDPRCMLVRNSVWDVADTWLRVSREQLGEHGGAAEGLLALVRTACEAGTGVNERAVALACSYLPDWSIPAAASEDCRTRLFAMHAVRAAGGLAVLSATHKDELARELIAVSLREEEEYAPELKERLALLGELLPGQQDGETLSGLFGKLRTVWACSASEQVKGPVLVLLATIVSDSVGSREVVGELVLDACMPRRTSELRRAGGECLARFQAAFTRRDTASLCAWLALLQLLQDEIDATRSAAVDLANRVVPALVERESPACEALALRACFAHAAGVFKGEERWQSYCAGLVAFDLDATLSRLERSGADDLGLSCTDLFEFEPDNVYAEPVIEALLVADCGVPLPDTCAPLPLDRLTALAGWTSWPGGPTFHPDVFGCVLKAVARARAAGRDDVAELSALASLPALHPHLRSLLAGEPAAAFLAADLAK